MPLNRSRTTPRASRARPAGPHCRGGASSLLRLTPPADRRLPTAVELGDWMSRAASVLMPVTGLHSPVNGTQIATHGGAAS
jgi:hypothetical protein